ncbi:unnamed protein product [Larinioides sclopetarius]|uniref:CRAL-TRIO domain-containing protein n=1 Tax=Larinioides sclopetarius TaxID=280406 RepID=A0AAV2AHV2_9ARAC
MALLPMWMKGTTPEIERIAFEELGETTEVRQSSLKKLKELINEEQGFCPLLDDEFLLRFLRAKKFDVSRAFSTLKNYYAFKVRYSGVVTDFLPKDLRSLFETDKVFLSPKRGPNGEGILVSFIGSFDIESFTVEQHFAATLISAEIGMETDASQVCGSRLIIDMQGMSWRKLRHYINPSFVSSVARCIQDVMPCRICGIHAVHEPIYFGSAYQAIKPLLSKKLKERIHFHSSDLSSLHKILPPETLPEELGGYLDKKDFQNFRSIVLQNNDLMERINTYMYNDMRSPYQRNINKTTDGSSEDKETTRTLFNVSLS